MERRLRISIRFPPRFLSDFRILSGGFAIGGVNGHPAAHGSSMVFISRLLALIFSGTRDLLRN
jgi:hypothetical protein